MITKLFGSGQMSMLNNEFIILFSHDIRYLKSDYKLIRR
ncbi:unknown [Tannerella sp. CAG:118]|uniref:Uncharacterized protein n=1 Tax=Coprobacter secundus subsp. similis TaxID=2751153 RepID=A0A7G1I511_9BACT|nr:hypothetical protein Cop2CBH44_28800 [Coprobacter secundus subsp. similis]CCY39176.1 unknown [Tannerella sp. CAG:118]